MKSTQLKYSLRSTLFTGLLASMFCCAHQAKAESFKLPGIGIDRPELPNENRPCENHPGRQNHCVPVLACVGLRGLHFKGRADGWDQGSVEGTLSNGETCSGTWNADGPLGAGVAKLSCTNDTDISVLYYNQDNDTGTVIGRGADSLGRTVDVWSGTLVEQYLDKSGKVTLPCIQGDLIIS